MEQCIRCGQKLLLERQNFCHECGWKQSVDVDPEHVGADFSQLDPRLVRLAMLWAGTSRGFCLEILKLDKRVANALQRSGKKPMEVLALVETEAITLRGMGLIGYRKLDEARNNWQ